MSSGAVQTASEDCSEDGSLLGLPPSVLVAVLSHLPDVCTLVRSCTACKALYTLLRTNTWHGVQTLRLATFDPSFKAAVPWICTCFLNLTEVDVSGCAALPEAWLAQLAAGSAAIRHLNVDNIWAWHGQECLLAVGSTLESLFACTTSLPLCSKQFSWLQKAGLVHLTSLKLAGLATSPHRCHTHGSSDCRCQDPTLLGALLTANPKLRELDLSNNPKLPTRLLQAALAVRTSTTATPHCCVTALTRISLHGCALLQPPIMLLRDNRQLEELDLSGTATDDNNLTELMTSLRRLRRLDLSGCTRVSDEGLQTLQYSAALTDGTLVELGLANLPRVSAGQLAELLRSWVCTLLDPRGWTLWLGEGEQLCGQQQVQRGIAWHWPGARRVSQWLLHLDVSHDGAVTDQVAHSLLATFAKLAGKQRKLAATNEGAVFATGVAWVCLPTSKAQNNTAGQGAQEHGCSHHAPTHADQVEALTSSMLGLQLAAPQAAASHCTAPHVSDTLGMHIDIPFVGFETLNLAGCSKLSGEALAELAACGCFVHLRSLDLSHFEGLRLPAKAPALAAAPAGELAHGSSSFHPVGAAQSTVNGADQPLRSALPPLPAMFCSTTPLGCGRHLQHLRLDGCHLTNEAAVSIASACPCLELLSLIGCRGLGDAGIRAFVANCGATLRDLSIGGASSAWREDVALQGLTALTSLRISRRSHLLDAHLAPVLAANPGLRALTLAGCYSITDAVFAAAPVALESLRLVACDGVTGEGLQRLRGLRRLAVGGCARLRQDAVQAIAVCCRRLVLLELPAHIGQQCLPRQAQGVGHLQGLKVLEHSAAALHIY